MISKKPLRKSMSSTIWHILSILKPWMRFLAGQITEESQIEHILDGILDFGDDLRFLDLSKKLCRHIYYQYPQLVGNFVSMYRALFVEGGNDDGADNNHDQSSQRCL